MRLPLSIPLCPHDRTDLLRMLWVPMASVLLLALLTAPGASETDGPVVPLKERAAEFRVPELMKRWATVPYQREILDAAQRAAIDPLLLVSVISVESGFRAHAVSHRGAVGLMQVLPRTAGDYGLWNLSDPGDNVNAGSLHLARLLSRFEGDVPLALAAYNAGVANVLRHGGVPPFPETRQYVARVLTHYEGNTL